MRFLTLVGAVTAGLLLGCSGAKSSGVAVPAPSASGEAPGAVDLSPVAMPDGVFALARVASPARLVDTGVGWSTLPLDWRAELANESPGIDKLLDFAAPLDFVAMLDPAAGMEPRVIWAFSFGAQSAEGAASFFEAQGKRVVEERGGAFRIDADELSCRAAPARGAARARVVCSDDAEGAAALSPYMTRGLPEQSLGTSDVHVHVLAQPFRKRYGGQIGLLRTMGVPFALRELSVDSPKLDRALRDALYGLADELIALAQDVDRFDLDATLAPGAENIDITSSLAFTGQKSWWASSLARAAAPGRDRPAPDFFWKLPGEASSGSYSVYSDPEHSKPFADGVAGLADGALEHYGLPDARRGPLVAALVAALTNQQVVAYATLPEPDAPKAESTEEDELHAMVRGSVGAHLIAIDSGGDKVRTLASEAVKSLSDKAFRERLVKADVLEAADLPTARERAPKAKGLPPGSKVYEIVIPAPMPDRPKHAPGQPPRLAKPKRGLPVTVFVVLAQDGPLTWLAFGLDEKQLAAAIVAAKAGTGATLANREGLSPLRAEAALQAGFTSVASVLAGLPTGRMANPLGGPGGPAPTMDRLPHRGRTPILWKVKAEAAGPRLVTSARIPKGVAEDLVAYAATSFGKK